MPRRQPLLILLLASSLTAAGLAPAIGSAAEPATEVRVGTAAGFTRIEFHGAQPLSVRREGDAVAFRFSAVGPLNLSQLHIAPPPGLISAERSAAAGGGMEVRLKLAPGAQAKLGRADGSAFLNLASPPPQPSASSSSGKPTTAAPAVKLRAGLEGRSLRLSFPWPTPVGAAVFRRGEAVWIVFDAPAKLDLSEAPQGAPQLRQATVVNGEAVTALRLITAPAIGFAATEAGGTWSVTLGPDAAETADIVAVTRQPGPDGAISAALAGAGRVVWLTDPAVGDRIAVAPARGPTKGLPRGARLVEADLLPSAQGLAVQARTDGLAVTSDGETVRIAKSGGLALSDAHAQGARREDGAGDGDLAKAAPLPGLVPAAWSDVGKGGFLPRYDALRAAAAAEGAQGVGAATDARFGLARFLVGSGLAYEAIGVLNLLARTDPKVVDTPEFRGLRGAARAMAGRATEADLDLTAPAVAGDPACALWRGWLRVRNGDYAGAREAFAAGASAIPQVAPPWRARFLRAQAEAALDGGDRDAARKALDAASTFRLPKDDVELLTLTRAKLAEADGRLEPALTLYASLEASGYGAVSAPATLHAVELRLAVRKLSLAEAFRTLDGLRLRWRGDAAELQVLRGLGGLYLSQGHYREALETLRLAGRRLTDSPASLALQAELDQAFKTLFLDGGADGLQPLQALALFDDFREQTPVGADGDLMVRKLARRLVAVDLLDQAANLLQYQVDNRLDGVAKAEVAADLASIYLMAKRPEPALAAIEGSRSTLLPTALTGERRRLEARALVALGRSDHALELLETDASADAQAVKAEIAWAGHDWVKAGTAAEGSLGERWKDAARPLAAEEADRLLHAAVAYSLAGDDRALARLREHWGALAGAAPAADALRLALLGQGGEALKAGDLARASGETDQLAGWIAQEKARFLAGAASGDAPRRS